MTYKDDIDKILAEHSDPEYDKSDVAHYILERFEQIKSGMLTSRALNFYKMDCFGLEYVRQIVNLYADNKIDGNRAIKAIEDTQELSRFYLLSKGYFPGKAESREKRELKSARKRLGKAESLLARIENLEKRAKF